MQVHTFSKITFFQGYGAKRFRALSMNFFSMLKLFLAALHAPLLLAVGALHELCNLWLSNILMFLCFYTIFIGFIVKVFTNSNVG